MSNIDFQSLSDSLWSGYASRELGEAMGDSEWAPLALVGLGVGVNYLTDYISKWRANRAKPSTMGISATDKIKGQQNIRTAFSDNVPIADKLKSRWELNNPGKTAWNGQPLMQEYQFKTTLDAPVVLPIDNTVSTAFDANAPIANKLAARSNLNSSPTLEVKEPAFLDLKNNTNQPTTETSTGDTGGDQNTSKLSNLFTKEGAMTAGGGALGGAIGSLAGSQLGRLYGNSKGGLFLAGVTSTGLGQIGSSVGSTVASNLANGASAFSGTGGNLASSFSNAGSLTSLGAGIANVALDSFDPVKKAGWEHAVNAGIGIASIATPYAALAALAFNGIGHAFGSSTLNYTADREMLALGGNSYNSTTRDALEAESLAGLRYSLWNNHNRHKDDAKITEAKRLTGIMDYIMDNNLFMQNLTAGTSAINNYRTGFEMLGGYDLRYALRAKNGAKLDFTRAREICSNKKNISKFLKGGVAPEIVVTPELDYNNFLNTLPDNLRLSDEKEYRMHRLWELGGKPKDFEELKTKKLTTLEDDGKWHTGSVIYNKDVDEYEFLKPANHPTLHLELELYEKDTEFNSKWDLDKSGEVWRYVRKKQLGGIIELVDPTQLSDEIEEYALGGEIQLINPEHITDDDEDDIEAFQNGGSINIIPEGALHAHKHHMEDAEHLTKKGIPVVDNNNTLQAEIEREEIIFRLEVTSKLEELQKLYDSDESSQSDKDKAALEAGLLLVKEILHNTIDNTNNLL